MRVVMVSDLQAHSWQKYPETNAQGVNLRLMDTVNELSRLRALCSKRNVDVFCVLGDIFEARNAIDVNVMNAVYYALQEFNQYGIRVILLVGNHDRTDVGNQHALEVFKPFCEVVDGPTTLRLPEGNIVAIPFHPRSDIITRYIKECVDKNTKLLLLHCAVKSLKFPNGRLWGSGISLEDIPKHVFCVMGHYHRWSELRTGKVWYLGSMIQVDRGDTSFDKYFAVYDSEKGTVRFYNTHGPKFVNVDVDVLPESSEGMTTSSENKVSMEAFSKAYRRQVNRNFVTVKRIPSTCTSLGAVEKALLGLGARHVEFDIKTHFSFDSQNPEVTENTTYTEIVEDFVEGAETSLDKERLKEEGVTIMGEFVSDGAEKDQDEVIELD